jgi:hypothetical protein
VDDGDPIGERHSAVAKHLFPDTPRLVNVKQRVQHKTHERRHNLAHVGAYARRLVVCRARSERVKKTGGLGVEPQSDSGSVPLSSVSAFMQGYRQPPTVANILAVTESFVERTPVH